MTIVPKILLLFSILAFLINGCTQPVEDGLPGKVSNTSANTYHPAGWKDNPQHGIDYSRNPQYCKACHGNDFQGGSSGVPCGGCHHSGWSGTHGQAYAENPNNCKTCHGEDLKGGLSAVSCEGCHHDWSGSHGDAFNENPDSCQACHGDSGASCADCHHSGWSGTHADAFNENPDSCQVCHGEAIVSCADCHHSGWTGTHGEEYAADPDDCKACHGEDLNGEGDQDRDCGFCHHEEAVAPWQHGDYHTVSGDCTACHGTDLSGGKTLVSCFSCHSAISDFDCTDCHGAIAGPYADTDHGNTSSGVTRTITADSGYPVGHCVHCHEQLGSVDGAEPSAFLYALFNDNYGANKNELCYVCHETFDLGAGLGYGWYGIYQGRTRYMNSVHNTDTNMVWPGASPPGPPFADYGNCHNCHNPHGYNDGSGVIPQMLFQRDGQTSNEMGCEACHDGSQAAKDIKSVVNKTYRHPVHTHDNRHSLPEGGLSSFGPDNSHSECVDCHNPHAIGGINANTPTVHPDYDDDPSDRTENGNNIYDATFGSAALQGIWGVDVSLWPARWEEPTSFDVLKPPAYPNGAEKEYQICFKCHSYYADEGTGVGPSYRVARDFNPNNRSSHPAVVKGSLAKHGGVGPLETTQLRNPWKNNIWNQTMYCSDCHGNDANGPSDPDGPHGSNRSGMLRSFRTNDRLWWPNGPHGSEWTLGDIKNNTNSWKTYLFCNACHVIEISSFSGHSVSGHASYGCTSCHLRRVHGWKKIRFLKAALNPQADPESDFVTCKADVCGLDHTVFY